MKRRIAVKKKKQNRLGMISVTLVVFMLFIVIMISGIGLREKKQTYEEREKILTEQIEEEKERTEELEELRKYTTTKKYVEEVAKEKLGLVYEDETLFQKEE